MYPKINRVVLGVRHDLGNRVQRLQMSTHVVGSRAGRELRDVGDQASESSVDHASVPEYTTFPSSSTVIVPVNPLTLGRSAFDASMHAADKSSPSRTSVRERQASVTSSREYVGTPVEYPVPPFGAVDQNDGDNGDEELGSIRVPSSSRYVRTGSSSAR